MHRHDDRRRPTRIRGMSAQRAHLCVRGNEAIGPYSLLHVERGRLDPGVPGQFFMLRTEPLLLPRPMSLCMAAAGELSFLIDPIGRGTEALARLDPGDRVTVFGPLGHGFPLDVTDPVIVGGGIGIAPLPYLSERLHGAPALLGFRSDAHAVAGALLPHTEIVIDPVRVTEPLAEHLGSCPDATPLACGPEPMLAAVGRLAPHAWLAHEAPMACGYGACFGCAVPIDGELKRLCVEGPTVLADRLYMPDHDSSSLPSAVGVPA